MSDPAVFEASSCTVDINNTVDATSDGVAEDGGSSVSLVFQAADGEQTCTVSMSRDVFNAFLVEHAHLADAPDPVDAPPIVVGRAGGAAG